VQQCRVDAEKTNDVFLDNFKSLMKDKTWPLMLILSGVPELSKYVNQNEQLATLLRRVHFDTIRLEDDMEELNQLAFAFAKEAGVSFEPLSNVDFFERLNHACVMRWGLVIELMIEALTTCHRAGAKEISIQHFAEAFALRANLPMGFTPFTVPDYQATFDHTKIASILKLTD
jgi:hypothetical protein